ncbi:MAG: ROK family protein [Ignavibacteriae bacterium]|jgi:glucokinase|nr:ROK family protein [Ignavibacteriota bacterium]NOG99620.1 ROK family protein [Ignavibacteriota bacterium]
MPETNYAVGIDLGGTSIKAGIADKKGKIIEKLSLPTNAGQGPEAVVNQIKKAIHRLLKKNNKKIAGIGIGSPGIVKLKKGTVENPPNFPGWSKVPLGTILTKEFNLNVFVENDANAAAIGELAYGSGKNLDNFLMVTLGTGVGGSIIINKKIYRGESGAAGEIGHVSIDHNGPKCNCGSYGCIEAYAGNNYLIQNVSRDLNNHIDSLLYHFVNVDNKTLTPKLIHQAALENDAYSKSIIIELGKNIGFALTSIINLLDITNVIIGGGVAGFGELLFDSIERGIKERVLIPLKDRIDVKPAKLKNEAGIKGASALVFYSN